MRELLSKNLEEVTSKSLRYRIPRFLRNYPRRLRVKALKDSNKPAEIIKAKTFWGRKMSVALPETVSSAIYTCGYFEHDLTYNIISLLNKGDCFIDIGAHIGYYSLLASQIVGETGTVYAFEPTKTTFDMLKLNAQNSKNLVCYNNAVYSEKTTLTFSDFGIRYSSYNSVKEGRFLEENIIGESFEIDSIVLDAWIKNEGIKPSYIKIDAESTESEILQGMEYTLSEFKPILSIEVGDLGLEGVASSRSNIDFIMKFGYDVFELKNGLTKHVPRDSYEYNNLVFIPSNIS